MQHGSKTKDGILSTMDRFDVKDLHIMKGRKDAISEIFGKDMASTLNSIVEIGAANARLKEMYETPYYE
jgi:predicted ATP-binding protein involved in virulence